MHHHGRRDDHDHGGTVIIHVHVHNGSVRVYDDGCAPIEPDQRRAALVNARSLIDNVIATTHDAPAGDRELRRADPGGVRPEDHDEYIALLAAVRSGLDDLERSVAARHGS